jgi:DNA polymerase-3 subunit gamma/tau
MSSSMPSPPVTRRSFACVDKVIEVGQDPRRFAEDLLRRLRDLVIVAAVPDALTSGLVDVAPDQAERLASQAERSVPVS